MLLHSRLRHPFEDISTWHWAKVLKVGVDDGC